MHANRCLSQKHRIPHWLLLAVSVVCLNGLPATAQNQAWIRQIGTGVDDEAYAAAPDRSGGVFIGGYTSGSLGGPTAGSSDVWLAHFDNAGNQTWIRQFGTSSIDRAIRAASDESGGVYLAGHTDGSLGGPSFGSRDAWLAHYDAPGNQTWIRQFGTSGSEQLQAATPDGAGGVYLGGYTQGSLGGSNAGLSDCWLARFDAVGNLVWMEQFGTSQDEFVTAAAPGLSGAVFAGGVTEGSLGGPHAGLDDAWLAHFDAAGNQTWIRQLGTIDRDFATAAVQDDSGNVYLIGGTYGSLAGANAGSIDVWIAHYNSSGSQTWIRQFGSGGMDQAYSAATDGTSGLFVSGYTSGNLGGSNAGGIDTWIAHYDVTGNLTWIQQFGTSDSEWVNLAAHDGAGGLYVGGNAAGDFGGQSAGGYDVWVARYSCPLPLVYCTAKITSCLTVPAIGYLGSPSASATSGFAITATSTKAGRFGLLLHSPNGRANNPFSGGYLCVSAVDLRRTVAVGDTTGTPPQCDGVLSIDMNAFAQGLLGGNPQPFLLTPGQQVNCQFWGRDTLANGALLTDALEYFVGL